jgi:hypothetical protein
MRWLLLYLNVLFWFLLINPHIPAAHKYLPEVGTAGGWIMQILLHLLSEGPKLLVRLVGQIQMGLVLTQLHL